MCGLVTDVAEEDITYTEFCVKNLEHFLCKYIQHSTIDIQRELAE